jgi:hypothetical protein
MIMPAAGMFRLTALGLALAGLVLSDANAADDGAPVGVAPGPRACARCGRDHPGQGHHHGAKGLGTLGYGPPGLHPGFQGFGLGYHLGYGYGGDALGVGAEGGYPFYGGPGYPRCDPTLRRFGGINPFPYFGGPGYPTPDHPNFYGGVAAPLVPDQPAVTIASEGYAPSGAGDFGGFTGAVPDAEARFAEDIVRAATGGIFGGAGYARPRAASSPMPTPAASDGPSGSPATPTLPARSPSR